MPTPTPLKLQKIEIQNFRGFPGPGKYAFDLNGKNLLLYGENGSGKSTLFHAITEFFDLNHQGKSLRDQRNLFSTDTEGEIALTFNDDPNPLCWTALSDRPFSDARVSQTALRTACLDYRSILQTSFTHQGDKVNLFHLLVNGLLIHYPVTVSGGTTRELGMIWEALISSLPEQPTDEELNTAGYNDVIDTDEGPDEQELEEMENRERETIQQIDSLCDEFYAILDQELRRIEHEAEGLLNYFPGCNVVIHLRPERPIYDPEHHILDNRTILLDVDFNGTSIPAHQHFLNEARLSAISLALYLASIKLSIPQDKSGNLKLLVLDDVLIGLDLSNRLPLLDILRDHFPDWQLMLMTYDKVWFDMVRMRNPESEWECEEIYTSEALYPIHRGRGDYLKKARKHLQDNDDQAAAMYARAEFERKLKKYCEALWVKLPFKQNLHELNTEKMLKGLEEHLQANPKSVNPAWPADYPSMFTNLRAARKIVLNPLSHSQLITLAKPEVQSAIDAVDAFKLSLSKKDELLNDAEEESIELKTIPATKLRPEKARSR